jgi:hypothetical protein
LPGHRFPHSSFGNACVRLKLESRPKTFTGYLDKAAEKLPECREAGNGLKYTIADGIKSAPAVFYFLRPPPLNFRQEMRRKAKRSSLETLFGGMQDTPRGAHQEYR